MTHARLVVELPDEAWIANVSRGHPNASFRVMAAIPGDGPGYALVNVTAPNVGDVLDEMRDHSAVTDLAVMARSEREATVQFETSTPILVRAAKHAGVPIRMPVEIEAGKATLSVIGSHERLPELGSRFEELDLSYRVDRVSQFDPPGRTLTDRQRETVLAAIEHGYYDTPRRCSLTELSNRLGLAKSTVSETLHRAEEEVVKSFLADREIGNAT